MAEESKKFDPEATVALPPAASDLDAPDPDATVSQPLVTASLLALCSSIVGK